MPSPSAVPPSRLPRELPDSAPLLDRLNARQRAFVEAYVIDSHATRAAALAGYSCPSKQGPRLKTFPAVRAAIDALGARQSEAMRRQWDAERKAKIDRLFMPAKRARRGSRRD